MATVAQQPAEPGEQRDPAHDRPSRELAQPPSLRYRPTPTGGPPPHRLRITLTRPLLWALVVAALGIAGIVVLGGVLASTIGLAFVAGVAGGTIGLVLARAAVPDDGGPPALSRTEVAGIGVLVAIGAVVAADALLWLLARERGGVLGPLPYLLDTFGLLVPIMPVMAALGAVWGVRSGPVGR